jgi:hypothetical protein
MTRSISTLLASCATSVAACAGVNVPIDGVVIDTSTGKPLPNAFVISKTTLYGADPVGGRTSCLHVAAVQADANGRFHISDAGPPGVGNVDRVVFGYKAGYQWHLDPQDRANIVTMRPFSGTDDERITSLRIYYSLRSCGSTESAISALRPLYTAIDEEASRLNPKDSRNIPAAGFLQTLRYLEEALERQRQREPPASKGFP